MFAVLWGVHFEISCLVTCNKRFEGNWEVIWEVLEGYVAKILEECVVP